MPTAKRQYQPSIDTYFHRAPLIPQDGNVPNPPRTRSSKQSILPNEVQASLLNVGMRVRKAVPDGYRSAVNVASSKMHDSPPSSLAYKGSDVVQRPAELTPFCGIHRIGGLSTQSEGLVDCVSADGTRRDWGFDEGDMEDISSSQSSQATTVSTDSAPRQMFRRSSKKRALDEDDGSKIAVDGGGGGVLVPVLPDPSANELAREIAQPSSRRRRLKAMRRDERPQFTSIDEMDFEEAPFLRPLS